MRFWKHKPTGKIIKDSCMDKVPGSRYEEFEGDHPGSATHTVVDDGNDFGTDLAFIAIDAAISSMDSSSGSGDIGAGDTSSSSDFGGFGGGDFGGGGAGGDF